MDVESAGAGGVGAGGERGSPVERRQRLPALDPRLLLVAQQVPEGSVVADIGTDHAYLPIYLVGVGRCPRAIATDIGTGPLRQARRHVERFGAGELIDLRRGPGLAPLTPGEADTAVMAGLGARSQANILARAGDRVDTFSRFVLQPQHDAAHLRRWLRQAEWTVTDERLCESGGRFYPVLTATRRPGQQGPEPMPPPLAAVADDELRDEVGPRLIRRRDPLLGRYLAHKVETYENIVAQMAAGGAARGPRYRTLRKKIERLKRLRRRL